MATASSRFPRSVIHGFRTTRPQRFETRLPCGNTQYTQPLLTYHSGVTLMSRGLTAVTFIITVMGHYISKYNDKSNIGVRYQQTAVSLSMLCVSFFFSCHPLYTFCTVYLALWPCTSSRLVLSVVQTTGIKFILSFSILFVYSLVLSSPLSISFLHSSIYLFINITLTVCAMLWMCEKTCVCNAPFL